MPRLPLRRRHATVMLLATLGLAGCASLPAPATPPQAGVAVPVAWSAGAGTREPASLADWWQRLGDPVLGGLVRDALQANTDIESARAALRQARALAEVQAGAGASLDASGSAQRARSASRAATNSVGVGIDASWEPDLFGGRRAATRAAELDASASAATLGDVQVSVAAEVALNYVTLRATEARLAIALDNLASQQETLQITQWRVQAGLATSLEAEQARAAAEQTRAQSQSLATSAQQSRHAIALLTGRSPDALVLPAGRIPQADAELALAFPADTLRQRPDVRAAEDAAAAAAQRVAKADADRYPSLRLSGSLGLSALTLSGLSGPGSVASAILASVAWPVYDGGAARGQLRAQQAAYEQAGARYRAAVLTALKDVEDALVALRGDRERLATLRAAAEAAGNAALLARQRYASGLVDFQTVLETQRSQLNAQDSVAAAEAAVATDHVRLYKALGGGWQPDAAVAANDPSPVTK
ncbi:MULTISPECIES: efflux transporter outer membrane subunit [Piscinibacter]|uniref:efflux transporter outer membrane subunit n=1 Tax=Piscinibacter TaxID=1114981 RepID=UPI001F0C6F0B|nr:MULTISPECIES: efflux transporter outer membrane subunit [Piscinibacter]